MIKLKKLTQGGVSIKGPPIIRTRNLFALREDF